MFKDFSAEQWHWAIDGAAIGLWSWDIDADVIHWSSQLGDMYGMDPEDYPDDIAAVAVLLPPPAGSNLEAQILDSTEDANGRFDFEHPIRRADGSDGWIRNVGRIEFDAQRRPSKLSAIAIDITRQK